MNIPPPSLHMSGGGQTLAGIGFGLLLLGGLVYALWVVREERKIYPLVVMAAGGLVCFVEPFVDILGHSMFPVGDVTSYISAFGRTIPLYMAPVYFFYFGLVTLLAVRSLERRAGMRRWWRAYAIGVTIALVFEPIPLHFEWWTYYGDNQPLKLLGLPIWWAFANTAASLTTGAVIHALLSRRILSGASTLGLVAVLPVTVAGTHTAAAFPTYVALNSTSHLLVTNAAQVLTCALSVGMVGVVGRLVIDSSSAETAPLPTEQLHPRSRRTTRRQRGRAWTQTSPPV